MPEGELGAVGRPGRMTAAADRRDFGRVGAAAVGVDDVERLAARARDAAHEGELRAVRRPGDFAGRDHAIGEVRYLDRDVEPGSRSRRVPSCRCSLPAGICSCTWRRRRAACRPATRPGLPRSWCPVVGQVDDGARVVGVEQADVFAFADVSDFLRRSERGGDATARVAAATRARRKTKRSGLGTGASLVGPPAPANRLGTRTSARPYGRSPSSARPTMRSICSGRWRGSRRCR